MITYMYMVVEIPYGTKILNVTVLRLLAEPFTLACCPWLGYANYIYNKKTVKLESINYYVVKILS